MAAMKLTRMYRRRLHEAGGIDPVYERLKAGETIGQIAASLGVRRPFLSKVLNQDKQRLSEIRGTKDTGGSGRLTPDQLEARIARRLEGVQTLREMIVERETWLEGAKKLLFDKEQDIELMRARVAQGQPLRPKRLELKRLMAEREAKFRASIAAKFKDSTPEDLAPQPEPMWEEPAPAAETEPSAAPPVEREPKPQPEPEPLKMTWLRMDSDSPAVAMRSKTVSEPDFAPPKLSATRLKKLAPARMPKSRQIQVIRLDR